MSQWMLTCTLHKAAVSSAAASGQSAVARLQWAARRYIVSSVPDRRKRNHFQSNKKDQKKKNADKGAADTAPVVAGRFGAGNASAQSSTRAKGNWDLFSSTNVNRIGSNGNAAASPEADAANAQQSGKSAFRNAKTRAGNFKKKQDDAKQNPVFTNKFQNLLSFAFDDGNDTNSPPEKSTGESHAPRNLLDQDDDDVFSSRSAKAAVDLSAFGFDDEADDDANEGELHAEKHKSKSPKAKFDAAAPSSPSGVLLSAVPSAAGASPDKRKQLKSKKKKDGRSLLKNFQFENSIFDSEDDIFGHVDWDEKRGDTDNHENREQRRFQRTMRKQIKQAPVKIVAAPLEVEIPTSISVKDLAERMCVKSKVLIRALKDLGERGMKNESVLSNDVAELAVESLNMVPILLPPDFVDLELTMPPADCSMFPSRSPIISVMGHVDHGKTTLLDSLRKSKVAAAEAGGITQSIGAFTVELGKKFGNQSKITFIDTPGHAAFSNMRSRGSEVTDIIVLVVAADDGVRPQTVEVIQLAQKNNVPLVVAVTKCDMHSHDEQEVRNRIADQLLNRGVVVEQMGGDTPLVCVSGKTGEGIDALKETIALHAEILDLRADDKAAGEAVVLEANVARGVGTQVDAIVKWGTLKAGTIVVCGLEYGKIRALVDQAGKRVKQISPGSPARVIGLKGLPNAGDALLVVDTEERAKEVITQRQELLEWDLMTTAEEDKDGASGNGAHRRRKYMGARRKWEQIELRRRQEVDEAKRIASLKAGDEGYVANIVPIIVKTDSVGVISAIDELIASLPSDEVVIKRIVASVGPVSSSDVAMAEATGATIYAFNIKHPSTIDREALEKSVSIRQHRVVYTMLDDIKELLRDNLSGVEETEVIGIAEVIQAIPITKSGRRTTNIAGCKVTMGLMNMHAKYRLIRDGETVVEDVGMESMRHFQEKVGEVTKGQECGLLLDGLDDFQPGDILQAYIVKYIGLLEPVVVDTGISIGINFGMFVEIVENGTCSISIPVSHLAFSARAVPPEPRTRPLSLRPSAFGNKFSRRTRMDPHSVNPLSMQPMSMPMGMQQAMSMPMAMTNASVPPAGGPGGPNGVQMSMGMNPMAGVNPAQYGVPPPQQQQQQQQMMMNMNAMNAMNPQMGSMNPQMGMKMNAMNPNAMNPNGMNPNAMNPNMPIQMVGGQVVGADWRIQLTREHRANLIAKIYNEMVRVASDPPPGIKLWMNVSWYELMLYKESRTQEDYITKIFNRLKSLRAQPTDMNAAMAAQTLPNNGMLSRLDFSYYSNANIGARAVPPQAMAGAQGQPAGYPGHPQFAGGVHPGGPGAPQTQIKQQPQPMGVGAQPNAGMPNPASASQGVPSKDGSTPRSGGLAPNGPIKAEAALGNAADSAAEYWRQHAALKAKYHDDVDKVHSAFKKYVDHMKDHNETDQKKKLRYLLSYVQLCASVLSEDKSTNQPRKLEELDKVYKYIVKIVNPYLKKLRTETDKRSFTPGGGNGAGAGPTAAGGPAPSGSPPPTGQTGNIAAGPGGMSSTGNNGMPMNMMDSSMQMRQQQQHQGQGQQPQQGQQQPNGQQNPANQPNQQQQSGQQQQGQQQPQQGAGSAQQTAQQKQQQYQQHLQRQHQMQQQQQRLQLQRQQQIQMQQRQQQQQQMIQQQQLQNQQKNQGQQPNQGGQQQPNQMKQQQPSGQPAQGQQGRQQQDQNQLNNQQHQQQQQQQRGQQGQGQQGQGANPSSGQQQQQQATQAQQQQMRQQQAQQQQAQQQHAQQQQQQAQHQAQQQQAQQQAQQQQAQHQQAQQQQQKSHGSQPHQQHGRDASRESPSLSSGLGLSLDDSGLYGGMDGSLLQMPSNLGGSGSSSSYSMGFPNDLSPTGFGDLGMLDIDGTGLSSLSYGDQDTPSSGSQGNSGGGRNGGNDGNGDDSGDNADLMTFVETL